MSIDRDVIESSEEWKEFLPFPHPLRWQMSISERLVLTSLLSLMRPECSIEIGTSGGGSLQALSWYSGKVYSLDIDPTVKTRLAPAGFQNVEFLTGDSRGVLPELLADLHVRRKAVRFVMI